ncbi:hypothetical protein D5086_005626 [Populus alba]|uniref:Uncharacterized protein n=1 Tax=Populus alba TaxID=43335 RepID=A0ACC4CUK3_POPAL
MRKSKAKSSAIRSGQGDFKLQSKRCPTPRTARFQSRSCSPVQSPSPTSIPPHSKIASSPLPAQGHSSIPCPNERIPTTPGIITPQAGCSQIPLTGSTPGTSHSPSFIHFLVSHLLLHVIFKELMLVNQLINGNSI